MVCPSKPVLSKLLTTGFFFFQTNAPRWNPPFLQRRSLTGDKVSAYIGFFKGEQRDFFINASRVSRQAAVTPHDPMTGYDDGDRVVSHRAADRLGGHRFQPLPLGNNAGNVTIRHNLSIGNPLQDIPHGKPEGRSRQPKRRGEIRSNALKIQVQPLLRLPEYRQLFFHAPAILFSGQCIGEIFLPVKPETSCQGLFHQIHKKATKKVPEAPYGS